jgi:hypothetical protein
MNELSRPQSVSETGDGGILAGQLPSLRCDLNREEFPSVVSRDERRLLIRSEVVRLLHLSDEKVQQLINTRQITALRIAGEERFDSQDLDLLIDSYKATAARRPQ